MGLGGSNQPVTRYNGIRTAEALLGTPLPILLGQHRISWKLIWYGAFNSQIAKQQSGGSGAGKAGTSYVYSASVIGAVCMGPCANFLGVWDSIGRYAMQSQSETVTLASTSYTPTNQAIFKQDLGVSMVSAYSVIANDYGSPGSVTLTGNQNSPLQYTTNPSPPPGFYTITGLPTTPVYVFNPAQVGSTVIVNYVAYRYWIQEEENDIAAAVVTVQYQSVFKYDVSVKYYPSGVALTAVSGTPTVAGTYNPNGGNYQFAPADFGLGVTISYIYRDLNTDTNAPTLLNLTFFGGALGQAPWSYLTSKFPAQALGYSEVAYVASLGLYLGYSPVLPQLNFEILGPYTFGNGIPDCNPADAIFGLLTNPTYKYNFPTANIDTSLLGLYKITGSVTSGAFTLGETVKQSVTGATATLDNVPTGSATMITLLITGPADATHTWTGQTSGAVYTPTAAPISSSARAMWSANNFFISDILDSQTSLMDTIGRWCEAGQVYLSWDEGLLKFIPLCDTTAVANGITYTPPTQPVIDLDDNDFFPSKGKDPVTLTQTPWQSRWNRVNVRWSVRTNDYNEDILQIQDEASVQQYGLISESAQDCQFICTEPAAQFAANMRLQRMSAIYTTYSFALKSNFAFLSPGDIVTITDGVLNTPGTMFGRTPVRITKMTDDPRKGIVIEAENFPWSVGAALLYNKQAQLPSNTNDGPQEDPGNTVPVIFELPNQAAQWSGGKIYIFGNGSNVNWGGFQLYVSLNGTDYNFYGQYSNPGRLGVVAASSTSAVFTLTQVSVAGAIATYSYSSFSGTISVPGANLVIAGFTNAGNNGPVKIVTISGGASGTFTVATTTQVNETHAAVATGGLPTFAGQNSLDSTDVLEANMQQSGATLQTVTAADRDAFVTLSAIVSPGQAFNESAIPGSGTVVGTSTGGGVTSSSSGPFPPSIPAVNIPNTPNVPWTNLAGVEGSSSYTTVNLTVSGPSFFPATSDNLLCSSYPLNIPAGVGAIIGLQLTFRAYYSAFPGLGIGATGSNQVFLAYKGSLIGVATVNWNGGAVPTSPTVYTIGSLSNLTAWGLPSGFLTPAIINDPSFGVFWSGGYAYGGGGTAVLNLQNVQFTVVWASGGAGSGWTNAGNIGSTSSFVTAALAPGSLTQYLVGNNLNLNLPFGFVLSGVSISFQASVSAGTAILSVSLWAGGLLVGAVKGVTVTTTPTTYTLPPIGSPSDLWAAQDSEDLDTLNSPGFGASFQAIGNVTATISLNSVVITVVGTSTTNLELISYETAALVGTNTYALSSLRRGVLGSYPCDHPVGSTFARLDQATLIYAVPSNFVGNTIFFKFLSFNAYGNQLQLLGNVVAYDVPIGSLSPGAIDVVSGALRTGTKNWTVHQMDAATSAVHGNIRHPEYSLRLRAPWAYQQGYRSSGLDSGRYWWRRQCGSHELLRAARHF
jgi:hypothetical protein